MGVAKVRGHGIEEMLAESKDWKRKHARRYIKALEKVVREHLDKASSQQREKWGFYGTEAWRKLRYDALKMYGRVCALCRTTEGPMHVDHIKPRSKFPSLALEVSNLQVLCEACNLGKRNRDSINWNEKAESEAANG